MNQLPAVAKKVYFKCTKCETDRYQVVLNHSSATSARLECEVCKCKNTFKLEEPKRTRTVVKKTTTRGKGASHGVKWGQLRDNNAEKPTSYNMKKLFEVGSALEHPKFGLGFVVNVTDAAIQVIFEDEQRQLVHNRT